MKRNWNNLIYSKNVVICKLFFPIFVLAVHTLQT